MFGLFGLFGSTGTPQNAALLHRIEQKIDQIMRHLGIPFEEPELDSEVIRLADAGQKIMAIKRYREVTGAGLKDAKDAVENYMAGRS